MGKLFGFFFLMIGVPALVIAQKPDSVFIQNDSLQVPVITIANQYERALQTILKQNTFLNSEGTPVTMAVKIKKTKSTDTVFYLLAALVFLMGLIKVFFARYFTNLFKVFFNTSFRQSQLADQLLQAKLPSLFFNAFFIISGGVYIYFLLLQYKFITDIHQWTILASCILILGLVYLAKFSTLKFTGWVTGYKEVTDAYVFVIFLICKIIGVLLVPFIILMAFTDAAIAKGSALASLLIIVLLLLLRFLRSYGLLQNQLKVSRFHFFLYIAGVEILPLLLIYKGLLFLLSKNL
ncbi:DUF4271 domain-containing protein [Ferruginibacter sp.]|nr:DUF4271 domain-containing protein [Ferruginibacter sp.]